MALTFIIILFLRTFHELSSKSGLEFAIVIMVNKQNKLYYQCPQFTQLTTKATWAIEQTPSLLMTVHFTKC